METVTAPITFYAHVAKVTHGGDGSRVYLSVKDSPTDLQAAVMLLAMKNKVLAVDAYRGSGDDLAARFRATIAPISTALEFRANYTGVKIDVPESDALQSAVLIGHQNSVMRFEIVDDGDAPSKKKSKGDHGYFWRNLIRHGFEGHPDMLEVWHQLRITNNREPDYPADKLLRDCFSVASRAEIAPARLREWLRIRRLPEQSGVWLLIDQAERGL